MKVKQHDAVRPSPTAHQARRRSSRFCRLCGGPIVIAPGSLNGVRCMSCGARPGVMTPAAASTPPRDFILPRPSGLVPARIHPLPIEASWRTAPERLSDGLRIGLSWRVPTMDVAGVRSWISDLPIQSNGAIITAAAAGVAVAIALTVTVALA